MQIYSVSFVSRVAEPALPALSKVEGSEAEGRPKKVLSETKGLQAKNTMKQIFAPAQKFASPLLKKQWDFGRWGEINLSLQIYRRVV